MYNTLYYMCMDIKVSQINSRRRECSAIFQNDIFTFRFINYYSRRLK